MLTTNHISWHFNPPVAPYFGECWERLISERRNTTFLVEVENLLNCRPLTYVSSDSNDNESITPNHLLLGSRGHVCGVFSSKDEMCRTQWRIAQHYTDAFLESMAQRIYTSTANEFKMD
jgi:hypothetical protein